MDVICRSRVETTRGGRELRSMVQNDGENPGKSPEKSFSDT